MFKGFQKPKRLVANTETLTERYGMFTAQPFQRGFGTTIGNSLRRVLLSSIEGAAITAVRIEGVEHEFSPIPGVVEDATDIILNLKQIPFKIMGEGVKTVRLNVEQPGDVRSGQIETDADVEVLDRDVHVATVSEGGKLSIEMRLKSGRGYVSADKNFDEDLALGYIPIDSVHSPVRKVNFSVEAARLGQMTDYDKLTLEVWTNGAVSPQDAIGYAAKLLKDHMAIFINFEEVPEQADERRAQPVGGRTGIERPFVQLPEERQHSDHRRVGAEDRSGDAADEEFRPQVSERDQGDPGEYGPVAGNAHRRARASDRAAAVGRQFRAGLRS
jgi:DNA-directed RNA polymerase subunit alpha